MNNLFDMHIHKTYIRMKEEQKKEKQTEYTFRHNNQLNRHTTA